MENVQFVKDVMGFSNEFSYLRRGALSSDDTVMWS